MATEQVEEMFGTFYHETFKNGGYCDFDIEYLDAAAAVRVITEAGGLAVLAHPGQQQNLELVPELVGYGLKGIELEHRKNTEADKRSYQTDGWSIWLISYRRQRLPRHTGGWQQ